MNPGIKVIKNLSTKTKIILIIIIIVNILLFTIVAISYYAAVNLINPKREPINHLPTEYNMSYLNVNFKSVDGINLKGWLINGTGIRKNVTIILCHGYSHSRVQMLPYARFLNAYGFSVFMFDFRAHGESGGDSCTISYKEIYDLMGAVKYLKQHGYDKIGVLGISMGAATAIRTAARTKDIAAVVVDSCFSNINEVTKNSFTYFSGLPEFPFAPIVVFFLERMIGTDAKAISPVEDAKKLDNCALFVISGSKDTIAPVNNGRDIYNNAPGPKDFWIVEGAGHVESLSKAGSEYEKRVSEFFNRYLVTAF